MNIYDLLKNDHDKVKKILATIEKKKDTKLFEELKKEVEIHSEAEEEAFYQPLQSKLGKIKIIIKTGHDEHDLVMAMMKKIGKVDDEQEWMELFSVIKKSLESHIVMEEEDIFYLGKKHFTSKEGEEAATKMKKLKEKMANNYKD
jgi:hemerythrin superfamily protein